MDKSVLAVVVIVAVILAASYLVLVSVSEGKSLALRVAIGKYQIHEAPLLVAYKRGFFERAGLKVELVRFSTGLDMAAALSRGDVDVAVAPAGPVIIAASRGAPVKIVFLVNELGWSVVARPESASGGCLKPGALVGYPGKGSPAWLVLEMLLKRCGVQAKLLKMEPSAAVSAMLSGRLDAVSLPEPLPTLLEERGLRKVVDAEDVWPSLPGFVVAARTQAIREKRAELKVFVEELERGSVYLQEKPVESLEILSEVLGVDRDVVARAMGKIRFDVKLKEDAVAKYARLLVDYGAISSAPSAESLVHEILP